MRFRLALAALTLFCAAARAEPPAKVAGGSVYAPVYSHLLHGNLDGSGKPSQLLVSATLSVRNTDPRQSLTLQSVEYFSSDGKRIRGYLDQPRNLPPMAATEFFVELRDSAGGAGASFLVAWRADQAINPPLIETVHTYLAGAQSLVFVSPGRAIQAE